MSEPRRLRGRVTAGGLKLFRRVADIDRLGSQLDNQRDSLGSEHPDTVGSIAAMARAYRARHDFSAAKELQEEVLTTNVKLHGEESFESLVALLDLGTTLHDLGELQAAKLAQTKVLRSFTEQYGSEVEATHAAMVNLANTLEDLGEGALLAEVDESIVAARTALFGPNNRKTQQARASLAKSYRGIGDKESAHQVRRDLLRHSVLGRILRLGSRQTEGT